MRRSGSRARTISTFFDHSCCQPAPPSLCRYSNRVSPPPFYRSDIPWERKTSHHLPWCQHYFFVYVAILQRREDAQTRQTGLNSFTATAVLKRSTRVWQSQPSSFVQAGTATKRARAQVINAQAGFVSKVDERRIQCSGQFSSMVLCRFFSTRKSVVSYVRDFRLGSADFFLWESFRLGSADFFIRGSQ